MIRSITLNIRPKSTEPRYELTVMDMEGAHDQDRLKSVPNTQTWGKYKAPDYLWFEDSSKRASDGRFTLHTKSSTGKGTSIAKHNLGLYPALEAQVKGTKLSKTLKLTFTDVCTKGKKVYYVFKVEPDADLPLFTSKPDIVFLKDFMQEFEALKEKVRILEEKVDVTGSVKLLKSIQVKSVPVSSTKDANLVQCKKILERDGEVTLMNPLGKIAKVSDKRFTFTSEWGQQRVPEGVKWETPRRGKVALEKGKEAWVFLDSKWYKGSLDSVLDRKGRDITVAALDFDKDMKEVAYEDYLAAL